MADDKNINLKTLPMPKSRVRVGCAATPYEAIAVSPKKETASCEAVLSAGADVLCCD